MHYLDSVLFLTLYSCSLIVVFIIKIPSFIHIEILPEIFILAAILHAIALINQTILF